MEKILFVDRDGCLIEEPQDEQVDRLDKVKFMPEVIPALNRFLASGYSLVMVTNQDGLGTDSFPEKDFTICQNFMLEVLESQGITFKDILVCPHFPNDGCNCRKPLTGLLSEYLASDTWSRQASAMVGDRESDMNLAKNLGVRGLLVSTKPTKDSYSWAQLTSEMLDQPRRASISRKTKETDIKVSINLDSQDSIKIKSGVGFFDHMLESFAKHAGVSLEVECQGDLHIDDHHSVEDVGLALGQVLKQALGDKRGIERFGFLLPMDEASCQVALDLSGRPYVVFQGEFSTEKVGELSTAMVPHFFRSLGETLGANLHIEVKGDNDHHKVESAFKGVARALRQAIQVTGNSIPSAKGVL